MKQSIAHKIKSKIEKHDNKFYRVEDFNDYAQHETVLRILARMVDNDELLRVRRGLYWRGKTTSNGLRQLPSVLQIVEAVFPHEEGIGYADFSAAYFLGLSDGKPDKMSIAVPFRPPRPLDTKYNMQWISRAGRIERIKQKLNFCEIACLEVLEKPQVLIRKQNEIARTEIWQLFQQDKIRSKNIINASATEPAIVRAGLANLISSFGEQESLKKIVPVRSKEATTSAFLSR